MWKKTGDQGNRWIQGGIGIGYTGEFQVENKNLEENCQKKRDLVLHSHRIILYRNHETFIMVHTKESIFTPLQVHCR